MPNTSKKGRDWFRVVNLSGEPGNQDDPRVAELMIFDQIGEDWWTGQGITAGNFIRAVDALGPLDQIILRINSPGGDVMDGLTITNYLMQHPANIVARVEGQAASIASVILMAGDERVMGLGATIFVHDPLTLVQGDADQLRAVANELDTIRDGIIDVYMQRVGISRDEVQTMMAADTRLTGDEAVTAGFATGTDANIKSAANVADLTPILAAAREQAMAHGAAITEVTDITAERDQLKNQVVALTGDLGAANSLIEELNGRLAGYQLAPANAADVVRACAGANVPQLAAEFIDGQWPMERVTVRLDQISQVRDICVAAGEEAMPYIDALSNPVELVRLTVTNLQEARDQEIESHLLPDNLRPGGDAGGKPEKGSKSIYHRRNESKVR